MPHLRHSLDHFIQRPVEKVAGKTIHLEGGIVIVDKRPGKPDIPDVTGLSFCKVILSELDTRLLFGRVTEDGVQDEVWVTLDPTKYTIGGIEGQTKEYYPQMPEELESALPRDPSPDRIADGPQPKKAEEAEETKDSNGEE